MTIAANDRRAGPYLCTGGETVLGYDFRVAAAADLVVMRRRGASDALLTLDVDYTVSGVGSGGGGSVVLSAGATAGDKYVVDGLKPVLRTSDLPSERSFQAPVLNGEYDALTAMLQEQRRDIDSKVGVSKFSSAPGSVSPEPNSVLGFDADGLLKQYPVPTLQTGASLGVSFSGPLPLTEPFYGAGAGYDALMWLSIRPTVSSESMPEVAQRIYIASGAGGSVDPANAFKMGQYVSVNASAGSGDVFGTNVGVGVLSGAGNINGTGTEINVVNSNMHYGETNFTYGTGKQFYGLTFAAGTSTHRVSSAVYITDLTASGKTWNRGIAFDDQAIKLYSIDDKSTSEISYYDHGSHITGIDLAGATYSHNYAIKLPNNKGISAKDSGGTERNLIALSAANTIDIGTNAGHTGFLYMSILAPSTDNTLTLGGTANRFAAVHALNVYAQNVGQMQARAAVNFNAGNADTAIPIVLPTGFTRYRVVACAISGASGTLTTATAGLFTAAAGGGVAVVTAASAITVSTAADNANNNMQGLTVNNTATQSYTAGTLYFRVATAQGAAATGVVTITFIPVS